MTPTIREILQRIHNTKHDAQRAHYFGINIGKLQPIESPEISDNLGYLQFVLRHHIILNIMKIFDPRNTRYFQITIDQIIEETQKVPTICKGLKWFGKHVKKSFKDETEAINWLVKKISRIRKRPYYLTLRRIRDKIIAHSQDLSQIKLGKVTWNNIIKLLKDIDWIIHAFYLLIFNSGFVDERPPIRYGSELIKIIREGTAIPSD